MLASKKTKRGVVGAVVLAGVLAVSGYALTNKLVFSDASTLAGFGSQTVQVLTVEDTDYTLGTTDKSTVDHIIFTLSGAVVTGGADGHAWAQLNSDNPGTWIDCGAVADAATSVDCDVSGAPVDVEDIGLDANGTTAAPVKLVLSE